jgi:hypothetical protein
MGATVAFALFAVMLADMLPVLGHLESAGLFAGRGELSRAAFDQQRRACEQYHYQGEENWFHRHRVIEGLVVRA